MWILLMHIVQSWVIQDCAWGFSLEELKLREQSGHKRENFLLPTLIKAVCWCQIDMLLFRLTLRLVIDFSTMKEENSKGSIKGDVCCTRACACLGLEHCRGWKLWILVPRAGSEKHRVSRGWKSVGDYDKTLTTEKCLKRNIHSNLSVLSLY